ncbi:alpha/beta hydrolase [uncultured Ruegeria sp.]|uniref:alpha/beta hydrolase n=1 Tax=uncultured Ruegeria sp. TaxID=259304 RepID=UPI00262D8595|nr:alpha/beta hydrolase [uncultured Ruegeria sp.]
MTLSPEAKALELQFQRDNDGLGPDDILQQRLNTEKMVEMTGIPSDVRFDPQVIAGIPSIVANPPDKQADYDIVFLHGGGFCVGSAHSHHRFAGHFAAACKASVVIPNYGLAPEHPFPTAVDQCVAVMLDVIERHNEGRTVIVGDSAGGGLALSACMKLRDMKEKLPLAAVLLAPWLDLSLSSPSVQTVAARDVVVSEERLAIRANHYLAGVDDKDPIASPLHGSLAGLPPIYVQASENDILRDDGHRLSDKAATQGADVRFELVPGMFHDFQFFAGNLPEADAAIARCCMFLESVI